jgi:hypothetical protein
VAVRLRSRLRATPRLESGRLAQLQLEVARRRHLAQHLFAGGKVASASLLSLAADEVPLVVSIVTELRPNNRLRLSLWRVTG